MMKWIITTSVLIGVAIFAYFYLSLNSPEIVPQVPTPNFSTSTQTVTVLHQYKDGVHRYTGYIKLPHSCYRTYQSAALDPDDSKKVILNIKTADYFDPTQSCAQIMTRYAFDMIIDHEAELTPILLELDHHNTQQIKTLLLNHLKL
jgi:hypothetical protein